jgi:hypothetical protein
MAPATSNAPATARNQSRDPVPVYGREESDDGAVGAAEGAVVGEVLGRVVEVVLEVVVVVEAVLGVVVEADDVVMMGVVVPPVGDLARMPLSGVFELFE